jgi:ABC-2 type transport system ATP-binding protein
MTPESQAARADTARLGPEDSRRSLQSVRDEEVRARDLRDKAAYDADREGLRSREWAEQERRQAGEAPTRTALVRAIGLTKRYLGTTVLNDVSLTVDEGEILGLVGPNGAGKTTLLRILATLTGPDGGEATICGYRLDQTREVRARIGFMPDVLGVYDDMLVREYLEFFARAHHLPDATRDYSIQETMTIVGIQGLADQPVDGLSRGMKQRLGLARAMLHGPKLLLLDEPASGLDPLARLELREILRRMQRKGTSVIISSHVLEDLADICTRVAIIRRGRLECVDETAHLIEERGARRMRVRAAARQEDLYAFLKNRPGVEGLRWDNDSVVFRVEGANEDELARLLADLVKAGLPVVRFSEEQSTLESAYLNVTCAGEGWEGSSI